MFVKVLASQKQLENRYKSAQQASEEWYIFHGGVLSWHSYCYFLNLFTFELSLMVGIEGHNLLLEREMRTLLVKHSKDGNLLLYVNFIFVDKHKCSIFEFSTS